MSEVKMKKVSANFNISTDSDLYRNIIEPKSSARCLSEFVHDLLDIYNSNSDIRNLIDCKIEDKNPLNQLKEQVMRVNREHEKTVMSANILSGFIDFNSAGMFSSDLEMGDSVNSDAMFENDGVLENLKRLLPESVQGEIKENIDKRLSYLESKMETVLKAMATKGNVTVTSSVSKVSQLVNNLETIYDVQHKGVIAEEVSLPLNSVLDAEKESAVTTAITSKSVDVKQTDRDSQKIDIANVTDSEVFEVVEKPKDKPKAFGKLMGGIKS